MMYQGGFGSASWARMAGCMVVAGCLALGAGTIEGDGWTATTPDNPDPSLPNVLCVGDSILVGYSSPLRTLLAGKANVYTWYMAFFSSPGAAGIPAASTPTAGMRPPSRATEHVHPQPVGA